MTETILLPISRRDFVYSPLGSDGKYVVKDPRRQTYFRLGPRERVLLELLDGRHGRALLRAEFGKQFNDELTDEDLEGFLALARSRGLLEPHGAPREQPQAVEACPATAAAPTRPTAAGQSPLYWRKSLFDPDRVFTRLRFIRTEFWW